MAEKSYEAGRRLTPEAVLELVAEEALKDGQLGGTESKLMAKLIEVLRLDRQRAHQILLAVAARFKAGKLGTNRPFEKSLLYERILYFATSGADDDAFTNKLLLVLRKVLEVTDESHRALLDRVKKPGYADASGVLDRPATRRIEIPEALKALKDSFAFDRETSTPSVPVMTRPILSSGSPLKSDALGPPRPSAAPPPLPSMSGVLARPVPKPSRDLGELPSLAMERGGLSLRATDDPGHSLDSARPMPRLELSPPAVPKVAASVAAARAPAVPKAAFEADLTDPVEPYALADDVTDGGLADGDDQPEPADMGDEDDLDGPPPDSISQAPATELVPTSSRRKIMIMVALAVVLALAGVALWWFTHGE